MAADEPMTSIAAFRLAICCCLRRAASSSCARSDQTVARWRRRFATYAEGAGSIVEEVVVVFVESERRGIIMVSVDGRREEVEEEVEVEVLVGRREGG